MSPEKYATIVFCCFQSLTCNRKTFFPFFEKFVVSELSHLHFNNHLFEYCKLRASLYQKALFLLQLNDFLCVVRSRAMFDKSTDPGNDWMVAQFVFLFLARSIFQETSTEVDVKIANVMIKTNCEQFSIVCSLMDHRIEVKISKLCSETTCHWRHFYGQ